MADVRRLSQYPSEAGPPSQPVASTSPMLFAPDEPEALRHQFPVASTEAFPIWLRMPRVLPTILHPLTLTGPAPFAISMATPVVPVTSHAVSAAPAPSIIMPAVLVTRAEKSSTADGAEALPSLAPKAPG